MKEALLKLEVDAESKPPQPMKYELRKKLIDQLNEEMLAQVKSTGELK